MNGRVLTGAAAMVLALGVSLAPAWADQERQEKGYGGHGYGTHAWAARTMGHHGGTGHFLRHLLKHGQEIGLTDEQVAKLKALQLEMDKTRIKMESDILVAERELAALVEDDKAEIGTIEAKLKQSEALEADLRMAAIKARRDAWALLTPEQREKERAVHEQMRRHHREGHHRQG
ncbi:Spy/CpxP family protein refolding chaperone [Nitrospira sp. Kam-Ns4a]